MKKQILSLLVIAFIAFSFTACKNDAKKEETVEATKDIASKIAANNSGDRYEVKTENSAITWKGSKPVGTHTGTIKVANGALYINKGAISGGTFEIDMTSITVTDLDDASGKGNLEAHLKGTVEGKEGHFFDTNKYPTSTFVITAIESKEGMTTLTGDLTIKDKTNSISFPVRIKEEANVVTLSSKQFEIDRTKWGVNYGSKTIFDNLGDKFVDDIVKLQIQLTAAR